MNRDQHNTALARKFKNFEVSSGMASFEAFEAREYQKSKTLIWFELAVISLAILLTILGMANARIVNLSTKATDSSSENHASAEAKNRGIHEQEAGARQETETSKILSTDRKAKELEDRSPKVPLSLFEKQDKSEEARPLQEPLNISYDASYLPAKELKGIPYQIIGLQDLPKSGKSPLKVEKPNIKPFPGLLRTSLEFGLGMQMGNYLVQAEPNADLYVHKNYQEFMSKSIHRVPLPSFRLGILRKASPLFSYSLGIAFTQWGLNTEYNYEVGAVPVYNLEGEITG
jgi:hypothetical protein